MQKKMDNIPLSEAKGKRKDSVVGFNDKMSSVNVDDKSVAINPTLLFVRLAALAGREDNIDKYFKYELTTYPMSLFKDGLMRKPDKAILRNSILTKEMKTSTHAVEVIDGGALLHQVDWPSGITFLELLLHYATFVKAKYVSCHVVFDGYEESSVKDHEHIRRSTKIKCKEILFMNEMKVTTKREDFLSNVKNKSLLISKLKTALENDGQTVMISKSDADTDIV